MGLKKGLEEEEREDEEQPIWKSPQFAVGMVVAAILIGAFAFNSNTRSIPPVYERADEASRCRCVAPKDVTNNMVKPDSFCRLRPPHYTAWCFVRGGKDGCSFARVWDDVQNATYEVDLEEYLRHGHNDKAKTPTSSYWKRCDVTKHMAGPVLEADGVQTLYNAFIQEPYRRNRAKAEHNAVTMKDLDKESRELVMNQLRKTVSDLWLGLLRYYNVSASGKAMLLPEHILKKLPREHEEIQSRVLRFALDAIKSSEKQRTLFTDDNDQVLATFMTPIETPLNGAKQREDVWDIADWRGVSLEEVTFGLHYVYVAEILSVHEKRASQKRSLLNRIIEWMKSIRNNSDMRSLGLILVLLMAAGPPVFFVAKRSWSSYRRSKNAAKSLSKARRAASAEDNSVTPIAKPAEKPKKSSKNQEDSKSKAQNVEIKPARSSSNSSSGTGKKAKKKKLKPEKKPEELPVVKEDISTIDPETIVEVWDPNKFTWIKKTIAQKLSGEDAKVEDAAQQITPEPVSNLRAISVRSIESSLGTSSDVKDKKSISSNKKKKKNKKGSQAEGKSDIIAQPVVDTPDTKDTQQALNKSQTAPSNNPTLEPSREKPLGQLPKDPSVEIQDGDNEQWSASTLLQKKKGKTSGEGRSRSNTPTTSQMKKVQQVPVASPILLPANPNGLAVPAATGHVVPVAVVPQNTWRSDTLRPPQTSPGNSVTNSPAGVSNGSIPGMMPQTLINSAPVSSAQHVMFQPQPVVQTHVQTPATTAQMMPPVMYVDSNGMPIHPTPVYWPTPELPQATMHYPMQASFVSSPEMTAYYTGGGGYYDGSMMGHDNNTHN
eukprot:m.48040 g.48040  ORF g.48040 m.48040 type:complete len:827 (+) comp10548_c0_seq1:74-2554(+)